MSSRFVYHTSFYPSGFLLGLWGSGKWQVLERGFDVLCDDTSLFEPLQRLSPHDVALSMHHWFSFASMDEGYFCCAAPSGEDALWADRWVTSFLRNDRLFRDMKGLLISGFADEPELMELFRYTSRLWTPVFGIQEQDARRIYGDEDQLEVDLWSGLRLQKLSFSEAIHGLLKELIVAAVSELGSSAFPGDLHSISRCFGTSIEVTTLLLEHCISMGLLVDTASDRLELSRSAAKHLFKPHIAALEIYVKFNRWAREFWRQADTSGVQLESGLKMFELQNQDGKFHRSYGALLSINRGLGSRVLEPFIDVAKSPDCGRVCDVGGGNGDLLVTWMMMSGKPGVLFDLPETVARAKETNRGLREVDRISFFGGDFFDAGRYPCSEPADGAGYTTWGFHRVLHDWSPEDQIRILKALRTCITNLDDRLIIRELLYTKNNVWASLYQYHTRVCYGGAHASSLDGYIEVAKAAGFDFVASGAGSIVAEILFKPSAIK